MMVRGGGERWVLMREEGKTAMGTGGSACQNMRCQAQQGETYRSGRVQVVFGKLTIQAENRQNKTDNGKKLKKEK